jgi:hypothetical protein
MLKYKVTMTNVVAAGPNQVHTHQAEDYVPEDILDAYVADARLRWQNVDVDYDAGHNPGPGGDDGATHYPAHIDHPLAGKTLNPLPEIPTSEDAS